MSSYIHLHAYVLVSSHTLSTVKCFTLIGAGYGNRNSDRDDPSFPEEAEIHRGAQGSHMAPLSVR